MKIPISRNEITSDRWINTSYLRSDGREEFRERSEYGNQHAVFNVGSQIGYIHYDKYNATDIPFGTINHAANFVEEKTGVHKDIILAGGITLGLYGLYKLFKS